VLAERVVLDVRRTRAGLLQDLNRAGDVDRVAEPAFAVDDHRDLDDRCDTTDHVSHVVEPNETEVGQAVLRRGDREAADVRGLELQRSDETG